MAAFKNIYWKVLNSAYVTVRSKDDPEGSVKVLIKVQDEKGAERLIGFFFDEIKRLQDTIAALDRAQEIMLEEADGDIHPKLKEEIEGDVH